MGPHSCPRCGGFTYRTWEHTEEGAETIEKCVNCGHEACSSIPPAPKSSSPKRDRLGYLTANQWRYILRNEACHAERNHL